MINSAGALKAVAISVAFGTILMALAPDSDEQPIEQVTPAQRPTPTPQMTPVTLASAAVEQKSQGTRAAAKLVESFDGLGFGFQCPQGTANVRNPSDNTLAVGPDHIVQIVNTRMAVFTKKGKRFETTGKVLYGPVVTRAVFAGFGGQCEARNNGDAVVRYDQLAKRWLIVMPIFGRGPVRRDQPRVGVSGEPAQISPPVSGTHFKTLSESERRRHTNTEPKAVATGYSYDRHLCNVTGPGRCCSRFCIRRPTMPDSVVTRIEPGPGRCQTSMTSAAGKRGDLSCLRSM